MFRLDAADHFVRHLGLQTLHYSKKTTYAPATLGSCHDFIGWELICLQCTAATCSELGWPQNTNYICWLDLDLAINVFTPVTVQIYAHLTKWSSAVRLWQSFILSWIFSPAVQSFSQRNCICLSTLFWKAHEGV